MSELALAAFAAETGLARARAAANRPLVGVRSRVPRARVPRESRRAWLPLSRTLGRPAFRRSLRRDPRSAAGALRARWRATRSCSRGRRWPSSARGPAPRTARRSPARSDGSSRRPGLVVVSGLARGVDGEAHRGALEAAGTTVAVLGCGIDRDYPASHRALAAEIAERGLVVSEYAPGVEPAPWRFPARNRIVAGLATVTVVVEAREASGALITADLALEEGREVFAVPGEITSALSKGTNALLRLGATPLTLRRGRARERSGSRPPTRRSRPEAATPRSSSRASATLRRPPTSSSARPASARARWRRPSPSSSWRASSPARKGGTARCSYARTNPWSADRGRRANRRASYWLEDERPDIRVAAASTARSTSRSSAAASPAARARSSSPEAGRACASTTRARSPAGRAAATAASRCAAALCRTTARASGSARSRPARTGG